MGKFMYLLAIPLISYMTTSARADVDFHETVYLHSKLQTLCKFSWFYSKRSQLLSENLLSSQQELNNCIASNPNKCTLHRQDVERNFSELEKATVESQFINGWGWPMEKSHLYNDNFGASSMLSFYLGPTG